MDNQDPESTLVADHKERKSNCSKDMFTTGGMFVPPELPANVATPPARKVDPKKMRRLSLSNLGDLLLYVPYRYDDMTKCERGAKSMKTGLTLVKATVVNPPTVVQKDREDKLRFYIHCQVGAFTLYIKGYRGLPGSQYAKLKAGDIIYARGVSYFAGRRYEPGAPWFMDSPDIVDEFWVGRVRPLYKRIRKLLTRHDVPGVMVKCALRPSSRKSAAHRLAVSMGRFAAPEVDLERTLYQVHLPATMKEAATALKHIDRINARSLAFAREFEAPVSEESVIDIGMRTVQTLCAQIPFELTPSQLVSITKCLDELRKTQRMQLLLSGDVGCGKSIVMHLVMAAVTVYGRSAAYMVPRTGVAIQQYENFKTLFPDIPCYIMAGSIRDACTTDRPFVIFGTNALLPAATRQSLKFGLVCFDEPQLTGYADKRALAGDSGVNRIESTATCIPRTLAESVLFPGRTIARVEMHTKKNIRTHLMYTGGTEQEKKPQRMKAMAMIDQAYRRGEKVAIVYPKIRKREDQVTLLASVSTWEKRYPGQVLFIHGDLTRKERAVADQEILHGSKSIIVATTVIEVGLDLPELRVMVVIDPQNYGLAQLHQLRGRVARKGGDGNFLLLPVTGTELMDYSLARLEKITTTNNGEEIEEWDLRQRGGGDLVGDGTRQSGDLHGIIRNRKVTLDCLEELIREQRLGDTEQHESTGPITSVTECQLSLLATESD